MWKDVELPDGQGPRCPGVIRHATNVVEHPELVARADRAARRARRRASASIAEHRLRLRPDAYLRRIHPTISGRSSRRWPRAPLASLTAALALRRDSICQRERGVGFGASSSTRDTAPPRERFDLWTEASLQVFEPIAVELRDESQGRADLPFAARLLRYELGPVTLYRMWSDASLVRRTLRLIRADDPELIHCMVLTRGRCAVAQEDRSDVAGPTSSSAGSRRHRSRSSR